MRTSNRIGAVVMAAALVVSACGGDDDSSDTTSGRIDRPPTTIGAQETTAAPETTAAAATPIAGGDRDLLAGESAADEDSRFREEVPTTTIPDTRFADYGVNPFEDPQRDPYSTFAVDVDTGSYTLMRAWIEQGVLPEAESVRVEEYVNYFDGGFAAPEDSTFALYADGGPAPYWGSRNDILRVGIKAREVAERRRQDLNLTLVVDVSGSMSEQGKLRMVKDSLDVLIDELDRFDSVAIVAYNDRARVVLEPTPADETDAIRDAIEDLSAGGTTNAEAGLLLGYELADESFIRDGINRVILLSDGVANVGNTGPEAILEEVGEQGRRGIDLVTIGVGIATYNDVLLEQLADQGDGWYAYVDTREEAERLFTDRLTTSLETVARDAKVQVEFDPDYVEEYRLIGFENRDVADEDFRDDDIDAGDINAGHSVTALYEVALTRDAYRSDVAFATVNLRWTDAETGRVDEIAGEVTSDLLANRFENASAEFQLVASVAAYAEVLRESRWVRGVGLDDILDEVDQLPWRELDDEAAEEFHDLLEQAVRLSR